MRMVLSFSTCISLPSSLEILTMLTPLTFLMRMVLSFSTCISLPSSSLKISWPFSSLTLTSPRIVIVGEDGEFDFRFGGEEEEGEEEVTVERDFLCVAGDEEEGEGGAKMEEKGSLESAADLEDVEEEEEEDEAVTEDESVVDFVLDLDDASSSSSSLPLDKLASFSLTSLILGREENLGIPGTPRLGDFPRDLRSSSSSEADIFCIMRFSIFFSMDSSMSTSSISLASSSASRMRRSDSASAFLLLSASTFFSSTLSSKYLVSSSSIWLKKSDSTDLARLSSDF